MHQSLILGSVLRAMRHGSREGHSHPPPTVQENGAFRLEYCCVLVTERWRFVMEKSLHSSGVVLQLLSRRTSILRLLQTRELAILLLLAGSALSHAAAKPVTAEQLEQMLAAAQGAPDVQMAAQLSDLTLIERLSMARLARCEANLPGPRSLQALMVLADMSAFLNPPVAEIPIAAKPDPEAQRKMIALTVDYVSKTVHQLPNFSATRVTTSFKDNPSYEQSKVGNNRNAIPNVFIISKPLQPVGKYSAAVLYRRGREEVRAGAVQPGPQGLTTSGEFGPILSTSLLDAAQGNLVWSHWEQRAAGLLAVFRFAVPAEKSHYEVAYCCLIRGNGDRVYFRQFSAYEGEITIDPSDGTILRLSLRAGLKKTDPIVKANIVVEYGPVELGGRTYICPVKGIALSLASEIQPLGGRKEDFPPLQTSLNDVVFEQYHLYRATSHIVPGDSEEPLPNPPSVEKTPD
jgi:hypothetical protein